MQLPECLYHGGDLIRGVDIKIFLSSGLFLDYLVNCLLYKVVRIVEVTPPGRASDRMRKEGENG